MSDTIVLLVEGEGAGASETVVSILASKGPTMAIWHDNPPTERNSINFQLLRTPAKGAITLVCLSAKPSGIMLHYWKGRSTPCDLTTCEACKAGHAARWKGYIYAMSQKTKRVIIFEYTERPHPEILQRLAHYKTLRGHILTAARTGTRPNSPLAITFADRIEDEKYLPTPTDLEEVLERMWEVRQQPLTFHDETSLLVNDLPGQRIVFEPSTNGHSKAK